MVTLGVYAGERQCAAAIAVDGRLVSAVNDDRYEPVTSGVPLDCVERALAIAQLPPTALDGIVVATDSSSESAAELGTPAPRPTRHRALADVVGDLRHVRMPRLEAQATLLRAIEEDVAVVALDLGPEGHGAVFSILDARLGCGAMIRGIAEMSDAALSVASAIGVRDEDALRGLEAHYGCDTASDEGPWLTLQNARSICVDRRAVECSLERAAAASPVPLDVQSRAHVALERTRARLATAIIDQMGDTVADLGRRAMSDTGASRVAFCGNIPPMLRARIASRIQPATFSPVQERTGAALGAALSTHPHVAPLESLGLGARYDDEQIKRQLENCRLDYVYEPDAKRLIGRASELLASGALVAWFEGPTEFGATSHGSRSVLCDPSRPYARDNVNTFLLQRSADSPLPLSMAVDGTRRRASTFEYSSALDHSAGVAPMFDRNGRCLVHGTDEAALPGLHRLLRLHQARTGVSGLINVPLACDGRLAQTPRDAVRAMFGSAADALVIGRFLISKDYWLLRTQGMGKEAGRPSR